MYETIAILLYAGALVASAVAGIAKARAMTARARFAYKAVRYQEDTKRQAAAARSPQAGPPAIESRDAADE